MGIPNIMNTGRSGMMGHRAAIATTGHNVANANSEGYTRQRVIMTPTAPEGAVGSKKILGRGVEIARVERVNDEYLDKQVRDGSRELSHFEEKDMALKHVESLFNELDGEGLNRIMARFFNDFRRLANDPDSEAIRQTVRESSQALISDFRRLRNGVEDSRRHLDARIEGAVGEINGLTDVIKDLNLKIKAVTIGGGSPNDLMDQRDAALKRLGEYMDLTVTKDGAGGYIINIRGIGPLVAGPNAEKLFVERSPDDGRGKPEAAFDIRTTASAQSNITHQISGGRLGALLQTRDQTLSTILDRLDDLAFGVSKAVNEIHSQGFTREGVKGGNFFKTLSQKERAAEFIDIAEPIRSNINNIAAAAIPNAPGDNRIAVAISGLQNLKFVNNGRSTVDDFYNSIVSDIGVITSRNRESMNQQKNVVTQLNKMREQLSGVSLDEETANLLQYQHAFDASAKVIQVADEMLDTILNLRR